MKSYIDEATLRSVSIFELRNIARNMGVNSPTIFKKEELIQKVLRMASGEDKPQLPKSRQGRPPKTNKFSQNTNTNNKYEYINYNDFFKPYFGLSKQENPSKVEEQQDEMMVLADPGFVYGDKQDLETEFSFRYENSEGYLKKMKNDSFFLFPKSKVANSTNATFVANKIVDDFGLKDGDYIVGNGKIYSTGKERYLTAIEKINEVSIEQFCEREDFDSAKMDANSQIKNLNSSSNFVSKTGFDTLTTGSRNIVLCENLKNYEEFLNLFLDLRKEFYIVNLCLDVNPEQLYLFQELENVEHFYSILGDSSRQNNFTINLTIDRIKRLTEANKRVLVVVNDVSKIIKYQNYEQGYSIYDIKDKSLENFKKLFSLCRNFAELESVTVVGLLKMPDDKTFVGSVKSLLEDMNCNVYKY